LEGNLDPSAPAPTESPTAGQVNEFPPSGLVGDYNLVDIDSATLRRSKGKSSCTRTASPSRTVRVENIFSQ
jgi:hypothetical protein